jgi:NAD(P)-dependent dehydrogenase (short-subunit alcohol dehydrogenase family)
MTSKTKTVVITGASSGIGKATAQLFAGKGWNVVATMRQPAAQAELIPSANLKLVELDVEKPETIHAAVEEAIASFGRIDVWVNNAGYGVFGPVEAASPHKIQQQFDVNVFGLIECIKAIAPHFRANRNGVVINVTSAGGLAASPAYAIYNASKFAVEGLSEGLWYELGSFGVKVKLIEPGVTKTDFGGRSMDVLDSSRQRDYIDLMEKVNAFRAKMIKTPGSAELVAATIFQAANDPSERLRYLSGSDAKRLWLLRRWLGSRMQMRLMRNLLKISSGLCCYQ